MATMKGARGAKTVLQIGAIKAPVQLYSTIDKPAGLADFETAGPNGGQLRAQQIGAPVERATEKAAAAAVLPSATLDADPGSDAPPPDEMPTAEAEALIDARQKAFAAEEDAAAATARTEPGEYRRALVEQGTGIEVAPEKVRKGIRLDDGTFVDCTAHLARIAEDTKLERMEIVDTVDATKVGLHRVKGSYYLTADGKGAPRRLRMLYEGMKRDRSAALVKWTRKTRQTMGVLKPAPGLDETILVIELAWAEDVRKPGPRQVAHMQAEVTEGEVDAMVMLLRSMRSSPHALDELRDDALARREEVIEKARAGTLEELEVPDAPPEPEDDLEAQLAASLEAAGVT